MSLWLSERKTAGLWAGGLWRSQQGSPYAFNLDLTTFKDTVTGRSLSCNIDGTRYDEVNGVTTAFGTDVPTIADKGLRICGAYSNLLKYSEDLSQSTVWKKSDSPTIVANVALWVDGEMKMDSLDLSLNAAARVYQDFPTVSPSNIHISAYMKSITTEGTFPIVALIPSVRGKLLNITMDTERIVMFNEITTTTGTTIYAGNRRDVTGATLLSIVCCGYQATKTKTMYPYIPTTTAAVSSPSEAGNSDTGTGIWIDDVATNFPLLNTALTSQGTLTFKWKTGFNDADVSGNLNILSFDGTTDSAIAYDADNNLIKLTDGTNTASKALTVVADTEYTIQATWGLVSGSPKMQIAVNGTAGTQADFTGTFNPSDIYFGLGNEELQYIKDFMVYKEATWL